MPEFRTADMILVESTLALGRSFGHWRLDRTICTFRKWFETVSHIGSVETGYNPRYLADTLKRKYRKKRNLNAVQAITVYESIKECQEIESQLKEGVEKIRDVNSDIEATRESLDEMTQKNGVLTTLVQTQLQQYCGLKERAMMIASQTRSLQARVKTLTYAEGVQEVRYVMSGLVNDMQQTEMKALMNETGIRFQHISGLLTTTAAESMI